MELRRNLDKDTIVLVDEHFTVTKANDGEFAGTVVAGEDIGKYAVNWISHKFTPVSTPVTLRPPMYRKKMASEILKYLEDAGYSFERGVIHYGGLTIKPYDILVDCGSIVQQKDWPHWMLERFSQEDILCSNG